MNVPVSFMLDIEIQLGHFASNLFVLYETETKNKKEEAPHPFTQATREGKRIR
jgi:hypothetical protein